MPRVLSFVGKSGTGKTTLISKLVVELKRRNLRVAVIKHAHHGFELDKKDSDSAIYRDVGADAVMLASPQGMALMQRLPTDEEPDRLLGFFAGMDLVITEGFKTGPWPKIAVYRKAISPSAFDKPLENGIAVVSDFPIDTGLPRFSHSDTAEIADFIQSALSR